MQGNGKIIDHLNKVLSNELRAIHQYFLHSRMLSDWGLNRFAEAEYEESMDEMRHADKLIQRILFLEACLERHSLFLFRMPLWQILDQELLHFLASNHNEEYQ